MLGLPGGFARNFNIWGGVGWGGDDNVPCTCTHLGATQLMFLALAHISVLRNWCFLHLHQVKLHQTAFMANRVKWIRCKLQVIVDFSARFGEKNSRLDIVKTFHDQWHLKTWYAVYLWKTTVYMEKHIKINTMTTRTTNGCGYSSHVVTVDTVPSRANPPGGANMLMGIFDRMNCSKLNCLKVGAIVLNRSLAD